MMVQAQEEMGEGSTMLNDPHYTPIISQPSSSQPQRKQKSRRPKEKDIQAPQSSVLSDPTNVVDEAVNKEPSMQLKELMDFCTKLQQRRRKEGQELKRLYRVGRSRRLVSSEEESLGDQEDASKQGRIDDIDADKDIYFVNVHRDEDIFRVNDLEGDEIVVESEVADKDVNLSVDEVTLAQALAALKSAKVQEKGDVIKEPSIPVSAASTKVSTVILTTAAITITAVKDKGKGKMVEEEHVKKMSKKELLKLDEELAFKLEAKEDEEETLAREKAQRVKEANIAWDDIQAKVEADYQLAQRLQAQAQEELSDVEKATLFVQLLEKRRKHFVAKRVEEKRNKPPTKAQQRISCAMKRVNTFVDMDTKLVEGSETREEESSKRAGEALKQESSKKQKVDDNKETKELKQCMEIIADDRDDVTIEATPLSTKSLTIVNYKIYKEGKKSYFEIIRADVNS
ncbi:hypothetical protein Tco_0896153 [Tanacetum coccineum]